MNSILYLLEAAIATSVGSLALMIGLGSSRIDNYIVIPIAVIVGFVAAGASYLLARKNEKLRKHKG